MPGAPVPAVVFAELLALPEVVSFDAQLQVRVSARKRKVEVRWSDCVNNVERWVHIRRSAALSCCTLLCIYRWLDAASF